MSHAAAVSHSAVSQSTASTTYPTLTPAEVRAHLLARSEIALLDVREEDPYAQSHPLWAANAPLSSLELHAWRRLPRRDTLIVLYGEDEGEDLAPRAAAVLTGLGYTRVHLLAGGLAAWSAGGGEVFRDVNVPSKAFGELVEEERHTPSLAAEEVQALLQDGADVVVLDARRFDEYQTMNIPGSTSVPGAELVLRARALAPNPATRIIVNCAGRTRSIIGTQSLVNAGLPNPVAALRNGTIGWTLANQTLEHGAQRRFADEIPAAVSVAQADARRVADGAGVKRIALADLSTLDESGVVGGRTTYWLDVRTPEEYAAGHLPGFDNAPGGQLVQETDHSVPVRGARVVLADDLLVRADMSASWLAQMGWEVYVVEGITADDLLAQGAAVPFAPPLPEVDLIRPVQLQARLQEGEAIVVFDVGRSVDYVAGHVPGARFALRAQLPRVLAAALERLPTRPALVVFTCGAGRLARWAAQDAQALLEVPVVALDGGTAAWREAGLPVETGETALASPRIDRYRRPYEGTDAPRAAMQAYLDWEFGLVAQLGRDGTHHFEVLAANETTATVA